MVAYLNSGKIDEKKSELEIESAAQNLAAIFVDIITDQVENDYKNIKNKNNDK